MYVISDFLLVSFFSWKAAILTFFLFTRVIKLPALGFMIIPWTYFFMNMNFWTLILALIFKKTFHGVIFVVSWVNLLGNYQHLPTGTKPLSLAVVHTFIALESPVPLLKNMVAQSHFSSIKIRNFEDSTQV